MQIIGFSGYAGSGKDAAAGALVNHGWEQVSFADPMREMAAAINPIVGTKGVVYGDLELKTRKEFVRYNDALVEHGYNEAKFKYPELRSFLQRLGTEGGRHVLGENIWVDTAKSRMAPDGRYVVADVRFQNEVEAIHDLGGFVIQINREGVGPANDHASERLPEIDWLFRDASIDNNGTIVDLHEAVNDLMDLGPRHRPTKVLSGGEDALRRERVAVQAEEDQRAARWAH